MMSTPEHDVEEGEEEEEEEEERREGEGAQRSVE